MEPSLLPARPLSPSDYERTALRTIRLWQTAPPDWWGRATRAVDGLLHRATDVLRRVPGVEWTLDNVVAGVLRLTNEITQDTVWREAILADYAADGFPAAGLADLQTLDLQVVDGRLDGLDAKYRALAAAEGAAMGYAGLPGVLPDVVALVALALRAAGEYATYCGFDVERPEERLYALQLLDAVASPGDARQATALRPLYKVSSRLARVQVVQMAEQAALMQAVRNAARGLGLHLTRAKMAQVLPVTGAVIGSGFNAYYISKVCDHAFNRYRERFLVRKYGPRLMEMV